MPRSSAGLANVPMSGVSHEKILPHRSVAIIERYRSVSKQRADERFYHDVRRGRLRPPIGTRLLRPPRDAASRRVRPAASGSNDLAVVDDKPPRRPDRAKRLVILALLALVALGVGARLRLALVDDGTVRGGDRRRLPAGRQGDGGAEGRRLRRRKLRHRQPAGEGRCDVIARIDDRDYQVAAGCRTRPTSTSRRRAWRASPRR